MKRIMPPYLIIFLTIFFVSCSTESFDELVPDETPAPNSDSDTPDNTVTTPCGFDLSNVSANETVVIDCVLDLQGETINLPANVNFEFEGGDIIGDGKLIFAGGTIAGQLLSSKLTVEGDVQLKEPTFKFFASRWDIVEGTTTSDIALENNRKLEDLMFWIKELGGTTFEIDKFDAYFNVTTVTSTTTNQNFYPSIESLNIPSDFHLKMSDNTFLRLFPNDWKKGGVLLAFREVSNSKVTGGTLWGDRETHLYSNGYDTKEEGQLLLKVVSGKNIVIDGVTIANGSKGGLNINSLGFTFQPEYDPTQNVVVRNCTFKNNRRMSTSITDGRDILMENNTFIDAAQPSAVINGGVVGYAINIEPIRKRENGVLVHYEKVFDVVIRNNVERGSRIGAFNIFTGENITIENNTVESKISYVLTSGTKIRNNTFIASAETSDVPAISVGGQGETVFDNEISGNTVSGYKVAISAYYANLKIYDNILKDNKLGIQLKESANVDVTNNEISSTVSGSKGIGIQITHANDVNITDNTIDVETNHLYFVELNQGSGEENNMVNIERNRFMSSATVVFSKTQGVSFKNNTSQGRAQIINATGIDLVSNEISSSNGHGVSITGVSNDILLSQNTISHPSDFNCINVAETTSQSEIVNQNNTCN